MTKKFSISLVAIAGIVAGALMYTYANATTNYIAEIQETPAAQVAGAVIERTEYGVIVDDAKNEVRNYTRLVEADQEITALELLQKTAQANDLEIDLKEYAFGTIVDSLAGRTNGDENMYWIFYVNNEMATVGAGDYIIQPGDVVKFSFEESIF